MLLQRLARHASALVRPRAPAAARCAPPPAGRRGVAAAAAAGLDPPDVRKLAEMAHIELTEEEVREREGGRGDGGGAAPPRLY